MTKLKLIKSLKGQRLVAKVLWVSKRDRNGILVDSSGVEVYFDESVCLVDFDAISRGDYLEFEINQGITDCICAKQIKFDD